ncbi:MAG TPA: sulfatase-like hydrolase/transferase, partial [Vicinamibacterales bacterium]|nr:sulfatase-like hydrolase/transferase [Vicinamibacterales bacterium]
MLPRRLSCLTALALLAACARSAPSAPAVPTNVLLVTLDTTRADRIGRGFTPTLDRLAAQGLRFTEARTAVPLTLPAHVSIMTGLPPTRHGVRLNGEGRSAIDFTIAAELKNRGYATRAVVGAFVLDRRFGLDAGFDEYDDHIARNPESTDLLEAERPANEVVDRAVAVLEALPADKPWFLWVHLYDAHAPYQPPAAALARAGGDPYNGEIAFVDGELGRLFARVDARSDAARTATIAVGDHGESLGEHGESTHGMLLFEPAIRVPLIIKWPGMAPTERRDAAGVDDIARTISNHARGIAPIGSTNQVHDKPEGRDWGMGRDLFQPVPETVEAFSETDYPTLVGWSSVRALVNGRWKMVLSSRAQLFDLATDPDEQTDVSAAQAALAKSMEANLVATNRSLEQSTKRSPATGSLPADTAARLQSLGYVAATRPAAAPPKSEALDPATVMADWAAFEAALADVTAGQSATAVPVLARLAKKFPDSPLFAATYARALSAGGRKREALERFRAAVATWPTDSSLYHELAVAARESGLAVEALRAEQAS